MNEGFEMGMDIGVYVISGLMAEGFYCTKKGWQAMRDSRAAQIQLSTGMPAEDFALLMQPVIDKMVEKIEKAKEV